MTSPRRKRIKLEKKSPAKKRIFAKMEKSVFGKKLSLIPDYMLSEGGFIRCAILRKEAFGCVAERPLSRSELKYYKGVKGFAIVCKWLKKPSAI